LKKLQVAIFISGRGSNLESLIQSSVKKQSLVEVQLVVSNNSKAKGLTIAKKNKIPFIYFIPRKNFENKVMKYLKNIDIICLAGFMQVLDSKFVRQWRSRLINIHPSYLPAFKGLNAQDQAINAKASYSGCSVHYVSAKIDSGKIILQKKVKILKKDNTESLSKKILIEEHKIYPRALQMVAKTLFDIDEEPTTIYLRANPTFIEDVVEVLAPSMNPENPDQVEVTRPSDALEAQQAAEEAFTNLLLGLGSVALLVGGVAIANVMVMSVLERRMEIGVRRSIGATRREIRYQFLLESIVLSGIGGLVGVGLGTVITLAYTNYTDIVFSIPIWQILGAVFLALLIGAISGVYPAIKASKIQPAEAVRK